jgi:hypothetical protein
VLSARVAGRCLGIAARVILRKQDDGYSEVLPNWKGETVVLIGGGSSLTFDQIAAVKAAHEAGRVKCIAINSAYLLAPFAEVCYFADSHWWRDHTEGIAVPLLSLTADQQRERFASFAGQKCSIEGSGGNVTDSRVHIMRRTAQRGHELEGLSHDPQKLVTGRNSGFQAFNMATLAGATTLILIGYDGQIGPGGRSHLMPHRRPTPIDAYPLYRNAMRKAETEVRKLGVSVWNCSPGSAIDAWPKVTITDALKRA